MRKYIYGLSFMLISAVALTACQEEVGTEPGNDGAPTVSLYTYAAPADTNDPDVDVRLRVCANSGTESAYFLVEKTSDLEARGLSEEEYAKYVKENGTQLENISGASDQDTIITNLSGYYTITVVAVNGSQLKASKTTFHGIGWTTVATGTYRMNSRIAGYLEYEATDIEGIELQRNDEDENALRFKNLYGRGNHLYLTSTGVSDVDEDGVTFTFYRVAEHALPASFGDYGTIYMSDLGYWLDDDEYPITPEYSVMVYDSGDDADYWTQLGYLTYYVSAGRLLYANEYFFPDEE